MEKGPGNILPGASRMSAVLPTPGFQPHETCVRPLTYRTVRYTLVLFKATARYSTNWKPAEPQSCLLQEVSLTFC